MQEKGNVSPKKVIRSAKVGNGVLQNIQFDSGRKNYEK